MQGTSVSDDGYYPEFCYFASRHEDVFRKFKRHPIYTRIVEYIEPRIGQECFEMILSNPNLRLSADDWNFFLLNDSVGEPRMADYKFGEARARCSPTTLRYIKVLGDIVSLFDVRKFKTVTEIGIGYGGQCRILMKSLPIERYNLVDLPEVLALTEKFLTALNHSGGGIIRYIDGMHLYSDLPCDFFISDFAFSELIKPVQDVYIKRILSKAAAGYINWDGAVFAELGLYSGYTLEEFVAMLPDAKVFPEKPVTTSPNNRIIVWGTK